MCECVSLCVWNKICFTCSCLLLNPSVILYVLLSRAHFSSSGFVLFSSIFYSMLCCRSRHPHLRPPLVRLLHCCHLPTISLIYFEYRLRILRIVICPNIRYVTTVIHGSFQTRTYAFWIMSDMYRVHCTVYTQKH